MFYKSDIRWKQGFHLAFWARLACFGQLGLLIGPQKSLKFKNGINIYDPKGLENKDEGQGDFFTVTTQSQSPAVVKFNMLHKRSAFE